MPENPQCLLIVTAEIAPEQEDAWNHWYDKEHLPEAVACPGVLGGTRYVSEGKAALSDQGKYSSSDARTYVAIYQLEGPEALQTPEFKAMRGWYQFSDHITSRTQVFRRR
ncbi:MAG: hypothetical protein QF546_01655 [Alphaproteobacteria bacterium]|jgi:hypothetical protein|nr:hypothetical protein [Alphaproteobacteria bacterium]HJP22870.1 DUF4286 family protein [Alphaproteobacteria bacterium]